MTIKTKIIQSRSPWQSGYRIPLSSRFAVQISASHLCWDVAEDDWLLCTVYTCRGESQGTYINYALQSLNKAETTLALKPRGDITRSLKQRYQWPQKWTCVQQQILKKIIIFNKQSLNGTKCEAKCDLEKFTLE